jgi:hypothetical protein
MTKWFGAALLAVTVIVGDAATAPSVAATRRRYANRPYYPYYYGRPYYYSPGPFLLPVPPSWGYGWQWW